MNLLMVDVKMPRYTDYILPYEPKDVEHSYYIYALRHSRADEIMKCLKSHGVSCGTYYPVPLHLQGAFRDLGYKEGDFPITELLAKTTFAIPVFPELYDEEIEYIIKTLKEAINERYLYSSISSN